jgi:hypothetical protein
MVSTKNRCTPCRYLEEAGRWVRRTVTTQELAPAKFFYQDTPEDLQLGEQVKAEDETKKANGTYEPRITETMDFHYVHDHQRHRFAQLAIGGRFWTTLYTFGKWGFIFMILPTLIGVLSVSH